ncbi:MAG: isoprenylcysteine carboxylmethyltransferase family protein [Marinilabiliales bacterium]|nr:isoprenylcysteine carboxylmethyltransferase family protein [Marinilabiliales bacterium]
MERAILETLFLCGIALLCLLELFYLMYFPDDRKVLVLQRKKKIFLYAALLGLQVIPFLYLFSIDFGTTDYHFWKWLIVPALFSYLFFVWLFAKALADLGRWWVPGQELKPDLELVRTGAYSYIRHPMYLSLIGIAVCQVFMIQNWIAGPVSLLLVTPFVFYQIRREERLLIQYFGETYLDYMKVTGKLWPLGEKMPFLKKDVAAVLKLLLKGLRQLLKKAGKFKVRKKRAQ